MLAMVLARLYSRRPAPAPRPAPGSPRSASSAAPTPARCRLRSHSRPSSAGSPPLVLGSRCSVLAPRFPVLGSGPFVLCSLFFVLQFSVLGSGPFVLYSLFFVLQFSVLGSRFSAPLFFVLCSLFSALEQPTTPARR